MRRGRDAPRPPADFPPPDPNRETLRLTQGRPLPSQKWGAETDTALSPRGDDSAIDDKNKHLYFDEAVITVCAAPAARASGPAQVQDGEELKYQWGRNIKKYIDLPAAEPADGGRGGNVYVASIATSTPSSTPLARRGAKKGYHGSAANAGAGRADRGERVAPDQEDLYIDVPRAPSSAVSGAANSSAT